MVTGIGSLPHRDAVAAARFSLTTSDLPAIPTLPRRSPAEGMISQAVAGMAGFTIGQYGSIAVDVDAIDFADHDVKVDVTVSDTVSDKVSVTVSDTVSDPFSAHLHDESYAGLFAFLAEARLRGHRGPVKWQFVGPVTLGIALIRAGVPSPLAFDVAVRSVRAHLARLLDVVHTALPASQQVVFLDEPSFGEVSDEDFDLAPDTAIDLVSAALAMVEPRAVVGLHCCARADLGALLATGPHVISVPVTADLCDNASRVIRFIEGGGIVCWGAVPTTGPLPVSAERIWRGLSELWCELVRRGADPELLRRQSLISPECGLGTHTAEVAERVFALTRQVSDKVRDQASAVQFALGA